MNTGTLRDRITLVVPTSSSFNRFGEVINATSSYDVWAKVKENNGSVQQIGGIITNTAVYDFTIRYRTDVTENCEIIHNGRIFNISFIEPLYEKNSYLKVTARRRE